MRYVVALLFVWLCSSGALASESSQSEQAQEFPRCPDIDRAYVPGDSGALRIPTRRAAALVAERVVFVASPSITVQAQKHDRSELTIRISSKAVDSSDPPAPLCQRKVLGTHGTMLHLKAPTDGLVQWHVEVLDSESGGPTGDPPYTSEINVSDHDGQFGFDDVSPPHKQPRTYTDFWDKDSGSAAACELVTSARRSYLEQTENAILLPAPNAPKLLYFMGGRRAYVEFLETEKAEVRRPTGTRMKGSLFAKSGIDGPFVEICRFSVASDSTARYVLAEIPWDHLDKVLWRLDVEREDSDPALLAMLTALREAGAVEDDDVGFDPVLAESTCISPQTIMNAQQAMMLSTPPAPLTPAPVKEGPYPRTSAEFRAQRYFRVKVVYPIVQDQDRAVAAVIESLSRSISTWRRVCLDCSPLNFAVLDFDNFILMEMGLSDELRQRMLQKGVVPEGMDSARYDHVTNRVGSGGLSLRPYDGLKRDDVAIKYLCGESDELLGPSLRAPLDRDHSSDGR